MVRKDERRDQVLTTRMTTKERQMLNEQVKKEGTSEDAYIRSAVLMSLCMDGNQKAIALVFGKMREVVSGRVKAWTGSDVRGVLEV